MRVLILILLLMVHTVICLQLQNDSNEEVENDVKGYRHKRTSKREKKKAEEIDLLKFLFNKPLRKISEKKHANKDKNETVTVKNGKKYDIAQETEQENMSLSLNDDQMPLLDDTAILHKSNRNIPENPLSGNHDSDFMNKSEPLKIVDMPANTAGSTEEKTDLIDEEREQELGLINLSGWHARKNDNWNKNSHEVIENQKSKGIMKEQDRKIVEFRLHETKNKLKADEMYIQPNVKLKALQTGSRFQKIDHASGSGDRKYEEESGDRQYEEESGDRQYEEESGDRQYDKERRRDNEISLTKLEHPKTKPIVLGKKNLGTTLKIKSKTNTNKSKPNKVTKTRSYVKLKIVQGKGRKHDIAKNYGVESAKKEDDDGNGGGTYSQSKSYQKPEGISKERTKSLLHIKNKFSNITVLLNLSSMDNLKDVTDSYMGKTKALDTSRKSLDLISDSLPSMTSDVKEEPSPRLKATIRRLRKHYESKSHKKHKRKEKKRTHAFKGDHLPDLSPDEPQVSNQLNTLQIQERTFFQNRNGENEKQHKYDTRKDFIPHPPLNYKRDEILIRRDGLPEYSLPQSGSMIASNQLLAYPAQYPELLNLQPMNRLYTSVQGLDTNEQDLLGRYLSREKFDEESLQQMDPDKSIQTDERGNLYQDDIFAPAASPRHMPQTKIIDQNVLNDLSTADAKALSSLTKLDASVLKDTSKEAQDKLSGASILSNDELSGVLKLLKQSDKAQEDVPSEKEDNSSNTLTAMEKTVGDPSEENVQSNSSDERISANRKVNNTKHPTDSDNIKTTSTTSNNVAEHKSVHRQAAHLLRNIAIRKKLMRIKLLEEKLQTLKKLEQSRRKHLLMSTPTPTTSELSGFASSNPTYLSNNHGTQKSDDTSILKNFFHAHKESKPTNKSSMFQDALYDRARILKWKFRKLTGDKKHLRAYDFPTQLDVSGYSSRERNFHLLRNNNQSNSSGSVEDRSESKKLASDLLSKSRDSKTLDQEIEHLKSKLKMRNEELTVENNRSSFISGFDNTDLGHTSSNIVKMSGDDDDDAIDETVTENGVGRSMNEFKFNGQINIDPRYQDNVKIVHGLPPPDFQIAFTTSFPPSRRTTPFTPFFTLPPGHATQQAHLPTFRYGYPWVWYKGQKIPVKVDANFKPTELPNKQHAPFEPTIPRTNYVTNTQPPNVLGSLTTVSSPLAEEYHLLTNLTEQAIAVDKQMQKEKEKGNLNASIVDGEIELQNSQQFKKPTSSNTTESNPSELSPTVTPPAVKNDNYGSRIILKEDNNNNNDNSLQNNTKSTMDELSNKTKTLDNARAFPSPFFVTYEKNSRHHKITPDDIILSDDIGKNSDTKTYIRLKENPSPENIKADQQKLRSKNENDHENMRKSDERELRVLKPPALNPHQLLLMSKEHEIKIKGNANDRLLGIDMLKENFDMNKAEKILLASKHPTKTFHVPAVHSNKLFHFHAKPGSLFFEKPLLEAASGNKRTYPQEFSSYTMQEIEDGQKNNSNYNATFLTHDGSFAPNIFTKKVEDFENDDKIIDAKTMPTKNLFFGTKSMMVDQQPQVTQDDLLREYAEQSRINQKFTAEILSHPDSSTRSMFVLSDPVQSIIHTPAPTKNPLITAPFTAKESVKLVTPTQSRFAEPTSSSTTTLTVNTTLPIHEISTTTIPVNPFQQEKSQEQSPAFQPLIASIKPTVTASTATIKTLLPLTDVHAIKTVTNSKEQHFFPSMYAQQQSQELVLNQPPVLGIQPVLVVPTFSSENVMMQSSQMITENKNQTKQETNKVKVNESPVNSIGLKEPIEKSHLVNHMNDGGITPSTSKNDAEKSPFEDELNLDDMYWTDSPDEIEKACKQQKDTNIVVNVLAFGDSLTRGYYNKGKNHHPYTMKLQYLLNKMDSNRCFIVENEGKDGDLAIGEMPKRIEEFLKEKREKRFDWVIILGGTNDIYNKNHAGRHTVTELTRNIIAVHNIAHHFGAKTVAVTIPDVECESSEMCTDMKQNREAVNENLRQFAMDHKNVVVLCDLADSLVRHKISHKLIGQFFEGGLHLRPRGYETMAKLIFDTLRETLDK